MKVFVTVGSMLPFDRLVQAMDDWAAAHPEHELRAQVGESRLVPRNMQAHQMLGPAEYRRLIEWSDLVVSHVGMGTVITASELGKPMLLVPRDLALQEVTSEHQRATAAWLRGRQGISIADDVQALPGMLDAASRQPAPEALADRAASLIGTLAEFVDDAVFGAARAKSRR